MPVTSFQYAVPISDISTSWSRNPAGGSLATAIDEFPFDISDNISSPDFQFFPSLDWSTEHGLSTVINPGYYADGWAVIFEAAKFGTALNNIRVDFKVGGSVVASWTVSLTGSVADYSLAISSVQAASISSYTGWSLAITALAPSGSPSSFVVIYGARIQVPSVGFNHLDIDPSGIGFTIVGPQSGHYLVIDSSGIGFRRMIGSEVTGALIMLGGTIKPSS